MNAFFNAPWSSSAKLVTIVIIGILFVVAMITPLAGGPVALFVLSMGVLLWIRGYRVAGGQVVIQMLLWKKSYDLNRLTRIEAIPFGMAGSMRVIASGGFFGFIGLFRSPDMGNFTAFVTDSANTVVMEFMDTIIVVSPDDPMKFVTTVEDEYSRIHHKSR